MKQLSITIPDAQYEILKKIKIQTGAPVTFLIKRAIEKYTDKEQKLEKVKR